MSRPHRLISVETADPPIRQVSPVVLIGLPWIRLIDERAASNSVNVVRRAHADRAA